MTAVNVIRQKAAVHVLTDGMAFAPEGVAQNYAQKVDVLPHLNAVMAVRGPRLLLPIISMLVSSFARTFDELQASIIEHIKDCLATTHPQLLRSYYGPEFDLLVAGISETRGPVAFAVPGQNQGSGVAGALTGLSVYEIDDVAMAPMSAEIQRELFKVIKPGTSVDDLDPVRDGLAMLECQRAHPTVAPGASSLVTAVGAFAQLTTVTTEGITTRVIHRWPDVIGQRVGMPPGGLND